MIADVSKVTCCPVQQSRNILNNGRVGVGVGVILVIVTVGVGVGVGAGASQSILVLEIFDEPEPGS